MPTFFYNICTIFGNSFISTSTVVTFSTMLVKARFLYFLPGTLTQMYIRHQQKRHKRKGRPRKKERKKKILHQRKIFKSYEFLCQDYYSVSYVKWSEEQLNFFRCVNILVLFDTEEWITSSDLTPFYTFLMYWYGIFILLTHCLSTKRPFCMYLYHEYFPLLQVLFNRMKRLSSYN